jgi:outer membrane lipoprotein-sorting protein
MVEQDSLRRNQSNGYTATRQYLAVNKNNRAEMVVRVTCAADGEKQFIILSEKGSIAIRSLVLYKMLKEETEASSPRRSSRTRITPSNYNFLLLGKGAIENRPAYVLRITPKENNQYLIDGNIWVDATDYSIVRIEGSPAQNPSYWTHNVHFVRTYQKIGPFWLAASTHSVGHIRIFGDAELTIENSNYTLNSSNDHIAKKDYLVKITQ